MSVENQQNQRKSSIFRPKAKSLEGTSSDLLKLAIVGAMLLLFLLPLQTGNQLSTDSSNSIQIEEIETIAEGRPDNLLYVGLPDSYIVTPGRTLGMNGFAYVNSAEERVYFMDPINETTINMALPSSFSATSKLLAVDVDNNDDIEFIGIRRVTSLIVAVYIVDFDSDTYNEHTFSAVGATFYGTGDFNGDTQLDVALLVSSVTGGYLLILDLATGSTLGTFDPVGTLRSYHAIGHFTDPSVDQIALTNRSFIYIINGDGSQAINSSIPNTVRDMQLFNYGGGLSDLIIQDSPNFAIALQGNDLSVIFNTTVGSPGGALYGITGNFTGDSQEDIFVQSNGWEMGLFLDGTNGTIIRETPGLTGDTSSLDGGNIDGEPLTDVVTGTDTGNPCFIHGATGEIAYIETLIDLVSMKNQIFAYDVDSNSRDDIFIRSESDLYILVGEFDPPVIHPEPIDPIHPTVIDDIITLEILVDEGSAIETAELFVRKLGSIEWTQPHTQLFTPDDETYFAFLVGLDAGTYEYFFEVIDIYLNVGFDGNETHPKSFDVTGHFAWELDKSLYAGGNPDYQTIASGNESDSSSVIYTLELGVVVKTLDLNKYSVDGILLDNYTIPFADGYSFILLSGMIDGDTVLDPVALVSTSSGTSAYVLHGDTFTENYVSPAPMLIKTIDLYEMIDGDGDSLDDLFIVEADTPYYIARMDADGTWTNTVLPLANDYDYRPQFIVGANEGYGGSSNLTIIRGDTRIEVYDGSDITNWNSASIDFGAYTKYESKWLTTMKREGTEKEDFILGSTFWNGPIPETHLFVYDGGLTGFGDIDDYTIAGKDIAFIYPYDKEGDQIDELMLHMDDGELTLASIAGAISFDWSIGVSDSTAESAIKTDFDGDMEDEFILFTKEDELLTAISVTGEVERTAVVGEVRNPIVVGNVDLGLGQDIAAFPIRRGVDTAVLGVMRDIDWFYRLDVSIVDITSVITQGELFKSNLTISNIYGEIINDASIYVSVFYMTTEGQAMNTFGSWFDHDAMIYRADTDGSWSMGVANLSLTVDHLFYHPTEKTYSNAITVESSLIVNLQVPDIVHQGENTSISVFVTDNLGGIVEGATVSVTIDGVTQTAIMTDQLYILDIPEVQLEAGLHAIDAEASHSYAIGTGIAGREFEVHVLTEDLVISTDFPSFVQQDYRVYAWFNITDPNGHIISNAIVSLRSGPERYDLVESPTDPGSYRFIHNISLSLGNQTFDLYVEKDYIFGPPATQLEFDVVGDLDPNIFYDTRVEGGSMFNIHVFVKDQYGPIFVGTSVSIVFNGTTYTQTNIDGNPDYDFLVLADFLMGLNNFTVYVNATYANQWSDELTIRAYSDASASATVVQEEDWIVLQGDQTNFELMLDDWLDRPVLGASITIFVRALSYGLTEISPGIYAVNMTTVGWAPGEYGYTVSVNHDDIETGDPITGNITVLGALTLTVQYNPQIPTQGGSLWISITVVDAYNNPVPDLEIFVTTLNMPTIRAEESGHVGEYIAFIEVLPLTEGYGLKNISIEVHGQFVQPKEMSDSFTLAVADPNITMEVGTIVSFTGISFALSLIGMFIYFRLAPTLRRTGTSKEELEKSVKGMDRLYLIIVIASALGLVGSIGLYSVGDYGGALILTVVLLGASVLLYGLWLYRDAVSAVMVTGSLNRKRMFAGLGHLFFVPVVIVLILIYGTEIDWFKSYMIDQAFVIGDIRVPAIMTTIFTAYLSSILVVVVNLYREVSKGLKKLKKMEDANTPASILEDERDTMVNRYSSSIRIKFMMFLIVVGAAAATTMNFLQSYEIGIIVLMPVAFLVVIPFISSKIVKVINKATSIKTSKSATTIDLESDEDSDFESSED